MKQALIIIIILFIIPLALSAQHWRDILNPKYNTNNMGFSGVENVVASCIDGNGNIYIVGTFDMVLQFGDVTLAAQNHSDIFIAKMNRQGRWQWAKSIDGNYGESVADVDCDNDGNIYIYGSYKYEMKIGTTILESQTSNDIFIAKISDAGTWQWAKRAGNNRKEYATSIAVDGSGNCYLAGTYTYKADFGSYSITSTGDKDVFLSKINSSGTWQWAKTFGGSSTDKAKDLIYANNKLYLLGDYFSNSIQFSGTTLTNRGEYDIFVAELSTSGVPSWALKIAGTNDEFASNIAYDSGQLFISGNFYLSTSIDGNTYNSEDGFDSFCLSYTIGSGFDWVLTGGGDGDEYSGVLLPYGSNVYFTGRYYEEAIFDTDTIIAEGGYDNFIVSINKSTGAIVDVKTSGSLLDDNISSAIVSDYNDLYFWGNTQGMFHFGSSFIILSSSQDIVYSILSSSGSLKSINRIKADCLNNKAYTCLIDDGYRYMAGSFYGNMGLSNVFLNSAGQSDMFMAKTDVNGNYEWYFSCGGEGKDEIYEMCFDKNGDIIICGTFYENIWFKDEPIQAMGYNDIFVAKILAENGNLEWVTPAGGMDDDKAIALCVDDSNNIYLTGTFFTIDSDTCFFDTLSLLGNGFDDIFISKLDSNGNWLWVNNAGSENDDCPTEIVLKSDTIAYISGSIDDMYTFGTITGNTFAYDDGFLAEFNSHGEWQKVVCMGSSNYLEEATSLALDTIGNLYLSGNFKGIAYFTGNSDYLFTRAEKQSYIAKLDSNLLWVDTKIFGADIEGVETRISSIAIDNSGKLHIIGSTNSDITLIDTVYYNEGNLDLFYLNCNLDLSGNYAQYLAGKGDEIGYDIECGIDDEINISGQYSDSLSFKSKIFEDYLLPLTNVFDNNAFMIISEKKYSPPPWTIPELTANTAKLIIPSEISPQISSRDIMKGDAVGVFYDNGSELVCAGYSMYYKSNMDITVRGDNILTSDTIDGCPENALYFFKVWDSELERTFATDANVDTGSRRYHSDSITNLEHFPIANEYSQVFNLYKGWNLISSYIAPHDPDMNNILSEGDVLANISMVCDIDGKFCVPDAINEIGYFNEQTGYYLYAEEAGNFTIYGDSINIKYETIPLKEGFNLVALWSNLTTPLVVGNLFDDIEDDIYLFKNSIGEINFPKYDIEQFEYIDPKQAIYIFMKNDRILKY